MTGICLWHGLWEGRGWAPEKQWHKAAGFPEKVSGGRKILTRKVLGTSSVWKCVREERSPSSSFLNVDIFMEKWCREMTEDETHLCSSRVLLDPSSLLARPEMPLENNQGNVCHHSKWWVYSYSTLSCSGLDRSFGKVAVKYSIIAIIVSLPFLRLCNLYLLFLFIWSLTLSSKYWITLLFKRAKDIIHGRKFFIL